jgi:hypothetical protein
VSLVSAPQVPGGDQVVPVLQAQDGSFIGTTCRYCAPGYGDMVAFDASGTVRWIVPNDTPQIATADGGVIAQPVNADGTIGPSATIYDQNGNATGQIASLPVQSWTGNAYQVGSTDQVSSAMIDIALSFNAFAYGSPSRNGAAVKVVRAPIFIPFQISVADDPNLYAPTPIERTFVSNYYKSLVGPLNPTQLALYPLSFEQATAFRFLGALATTNTIVSYMDHGEMAEGEFNARGLCFWAWCMAPEALRPYPCFDQVCILGPPTTVPATQLYPIEDGFSPKAKLIFLAMCGVDQAFIDQWHLSATGQALIVPNYSNTNPQMHLDLNYAKDEWNKILLALAKGSNVQAAVAAGNAVATANQNPPEHTWQIIGDPFLTFHANTQQ